MPTYTFRCSDCGDFDINVPINDRNSVVCHCGNETSRIYSMPAIKLRGKGFYTTDVGNLDKQQAQGRRMEREGKIRPGHDLTRHERN